MTCGGVYLLHASLWKLWCCCRGFLGGCLRLSKMLKIQQTHHLQVSLMSTCIESCTEATVYERYNNRPPQWQAGYMHLFIFPPIQNHLGLYGGWLKIRIGYTFIYIYFCRVELLDWSWIISTESNSTPFICGAVINGGKMQAVAKEKKNANYSAQRLLTNWRHHFSNYIITIFWKC